MQLTILQAKLKSIGIYTGTVDGKDGPKTQAAVEAFLAAGKIDASKFTPARKRIAAEQLLFKQAGLNPGVIDGYVGPDTRQAEAEFAQLITTGKVTYWRDEAEEAPVLVPASATVNKGAKAEQAKYPLQSGVEAFYGKPGTGHVSIQVPFSLRIAWNKTQKVNKITVHEKIAKAVEAGFTKIQAAYSAEDISKHGFDLFGGCFNDRNMRGGTKKSMHAYACAIDFDPERNQLKWTRKQAYLAKPVCAEFFDIWESVGAISLGRQRDYDWMHIQWARLA